MKFYLRTIFIGIIITSACVGFGFVVFWNQPSERIVPYKTNVRSLEVRIPREHRQKDMQREKKKEAEDKHDEKMYTVHNFNQKGDEDALAELIKRVVRGEMKSVLRDELSQQEQLLKNIQLRLKERAEKQTEERQEHQQQFKEQLEQHLLQQTAQQKQQGEYQQQHEQHGQQQQLQLQLEQKEHQLQQQQKQQLQQSNQEQLQMQQQQQHQKQIEQQQEQQQQQLQQLQQSLQQQQQQQQLPQRQQKLSNDLSMRQLHEETYSKLAKEEILEYYQVERDSQIRFERVLDVQKDRKILRTLFPDPIEHRDRVTDQLRVKLNVKTLKTIYVSGFSGNNQEKFEQDNCNVKLCRFSNNVRDMANADAIYSESAFSRHRSQNQNQILLSFQIESAANAQVIGREINWTASYRRDSVLNAPYERFTPFLNVTDLPTKPLRNFAQGKTKMAAWFVSNCDAVNQRDKLVQELKKYIPVDVYGLCGTLNCERSDKDCFKKLKTDYKFYLSLENSNCKDYVTEKLFWNGLQNDVIPVVMGAHRNEVKRIAPPNSYIHVDDFESPQQLAEYLKFLDKNDEAYNQYFLWKDTGRFINTKFMCRLCTMVHLAPHFPMWYTDADKWWNEDTCVYPRQNGTLKYGTWRGRTETRQYVKYVRYGNVL